MSQRTKIIAGVIALILGAVAIGWLYFQLSPGAWDQFKAEMTGEASSSASEPQQIIRRTSPTAGQLVASGNIEAEEVTVAAEVGGRIAEIGAGEGDDITAGDFLLQVDQAVLLAQRQGTLANVDQAQAAVEAAKAHLNQALAGATEEEIAAAEAAVLAAEGAVAAAEAALKAAEAQSSQLDTGPRAGQIAAAEAEIRLAGVKLQQAQAAYDRVRYAPDIQMRPESAALEQATIAYETAQAYRDALFEGATAAERQVAAAQEEAARVQITQAQDQALSACAQVAQASAAVQAATSSDNPVLYRFQRKTGHGQGAPRSIIIEEIVDEWGFVFWQLGM